MLKVDAARVAEMLLCKSCRRELQVEATQIAHVALNDGGVLAWPVCDEHAHWAMVAGWFPIDPVRRHLGASDAQE